MKVLFASYEASPFYKKGGLGDVAGSLPLALAKIGVDVTLILPGYKFLSLPNKTETIGSFEVIFNHKNEKVTIRKMQYNQKNTLYIVDNPILSEMADGKIKTINFAFFSKAIATLLSLKNVKEFEHFDLVHLNDWHTASVSYFLSKMDKSCRFPTLLTLHNLLYQGTLNKEELSILIGNEIDDKDYQDLLELGIKYADFITTVSPSYAKEIIKTRKGMNLRKLLFEKRDRIKGILNGIDVRKWDPSNDNFINKFSQSSFQKGKENNKLALQKELKLPVDFSKVLVSFIGRLEPHQKGIDLILKTLEETLGQENYQMVILGTGHPSWAKKIGALVKKHPRKIVFINKFDEKLSHKIYAASDLVLIPSKFEPCGLVQMIAMRYGSLPLVRKTGGLKDTVKDGYNGFVFEKYSSSELSRTLRLALKIFRENPKKISEMRLNAMKEDFSWDKSARAYKKLYSNVIKTASCPAVTSR